MSKLYNIFLLLGFIFFGIAIGIKIGKNAEKKTNTNIEYPTFYHSIDHITQPRIASHKYYVALRRYKDSLMNTWSGYGTRLSGLNQPMLSPDSV